ncbi:MAG: hypothetical protein ACYTGY_18495 [Planctomycetota bacterium]|jgi:hypothetical protein
MKHRLATITIFLVLGLFVNVSVAWICVYAVVLGGLEARQCELSHGVYWSVLSWRGFGSRRVVSVRPDVVPLGDDRLRDDHPALPGWSEFQAADAVSGRSSLVIEAAEARGWPFLALSASFEAGSPPPSFDTELSLYGVTIHAPTDPSNLYDASGRTLPLRPVWGGFIANTLLYAAAAWLLSLLPAARRRRIHRARGLCPNCGYPPGASAKCTECGAALGVSLVTATDEDGAIR